MQKYQSTKDLIQTLTNLTSKHDFIKEIETDLDLVIQNLKNKGYQVDKTVGLVGKQRLNGNDIFVYQYLRDLHFIFWGLTTNNWQTFEPFETIYYSNLNMIILEYYNNKQ